MPKSFLTVLIFCLCCAFVSETSAQAFLANGKIPKDLLITYQFYGRFQIKLKIGSDRKLRVEDDTVRRALGADFLRYEAMKAFKKIPEERLKQLIHDFEKMDFFNLKDDYSTYNDSCKSFITDSGSVRISLQIDGKSKEIFFEKGCLNETEPNIRKLKDLSEKIEQIQRDVKYSEPKK